MSSRLTLTHNGKVFLDRWGLECKWFGVFVHHITGPDPGLDLHDHPWPFLSFVIHGGYSEQYAEARHSSGWSHGSLRVWNRWSIHLMPLVATHRIIHAKPNTWTVVIRGRLSRPWGFYLPWGWVDQRDYDYATRRPVKEAQGAATPSD